MLKNVATNLDIYFPEREEGEGLVEDGVMISLIAVVEIVGLFIVGSMIAAMSTSFGSSV